LAVIRGEKYLPAIGQVAVLAVAEMSHRSIRSAANAAAKRPSKEIPTEL
jgi:hypothetical protein